MYFGNRRVIKRQGPYRELPLSVSDRAQVTERYDIPLDAWLRGWKLASVAEPHRGPDPVVLYDSMNTILHEWPEGYDPGWAECYEVCFKLLRKG